ncbi:MAG TPA: sigma-70 family RNA polymerase sigma factor [Terriglobia bacterium]|nr:sigma-70 family RNA polymerase sigma factor [Terriglobia bacterium]
MTDTRQVTEPWNSEFERFYLEHYGRVVSVLFRLTANRIEADELAQEVFWKLYRRQLLPSSDGNVAGWLYRTATNLGIDALRREVRRRDYEHQAARAAAQNAPAGGPLDELVRDEKRRRVRQVLARLKPVQAQALILRAGGFSYHEVAAALRVKRVSVGTLLLRAEQAFRNHYRAAGKDNRQEEEAL